MLIYISKSKFDNLLKEKRIKNHLLNLVSGFGINKITMGRGSNINDTSISIEAGFNNNSPYTENDISSVLRYLEKSGSIETVTPNSAIRIGKYIHSFGTLKYIKFENGTIASCLNQENLESIQGDMEFFEDDKLFFDIKISHNLYNCVCIKMTAKNIEVFGGTNLRVRYKELFSEDMMLRYSSSADPGILYGNVDVEFIVLVTNIDYNNNCIIGSPVIIYS